MRRLIIFALLALAIAACAPRYAPVSLNLDTNAPAATKKSFLNQLIEHLAARMEIPFAKVHQQGKYKYIGERSTSDSRAFVYLFQSMEVRYTPYSFIYMRFEDKPYMIAQENTSLMDKQEGVTEEIDGMTHIGTFRLALYNATFCVGDTFDMPQVTDTEIKIVPAVKKNLRKHLYEMFLNYHTQLLCMGSGTELQTWEQPQELGSVRFYFDTAEDMRRFAYALRAAYPAAGIEDLSGRIK